jgi:hypothetical protein
MTLSDILKLIVLIKVIFVPYENFENIVELIGEESFSKIYKATND